MKILVLFLAAASAVTVYRNEESTDPDSMALESEPRTRQQRGSLTYKHNQHKVQESGEDDPQPNGSYAYRQQRHESDAEPNHRPRQQRQSAKEAPRPRRQPQLPASEAQTGGPFFQSFHEVEGDDQKLGYTSYVEHEESTEDAAHEGSIDIKKVAPKSSVQVQIYHAPEPQQQQQHRAQQKEVSHSKQKNKNPKIYNEAYPGFNKQQSAFQGGEVIDLTGNNEGLSAYLSSSSVFQPSGKFRPLNAEDFHQEGFEGIAGSFTNHHANQEVFPPFTPPKNLRGRLTKERQRVLPEVDEAKKIDPETISVSMSPSWKTLTANLEIAASDEANAKGKVRRPKEVSSSLFAQFDEHERFKAQRFDHEKALRSSTPFGVNNVMGGFEGEPLFSQVKEVSEAPHEHNPFLFTPTQTKAIDTHLVSSNKAPLTFHNGEKFVKIPKNTKTVLAGGFEIPVMTQDEYEKHFGNIRSESKRPDNKKPEKLRPTRLAFDGRGKPQQQLNKNQQQSHSFAQFNSISVSKPQNSQSRPNQHQTSQIRNQNHQMQQNTLQNHQVHHNALQNAHLNSLQNNQNHQFRLQQQAKVPFQGKNNVDVFPSLGFSLQNRRNISIVPERQGKVLPGLESPYPQQFSVSASYKIDRSSAQ